MITQPTFLINETIARANIHAMAAKAAAHGLIFRPHFKTHQSVQVGEWFREASVTAITVSSVTMAKQFANAGWNDITLAFPMNLREAAAVAELAGQIRLNVLFDAPEQVTALTPLLKHEAGFFIKIDTGYHRAGVLPDDTNRIDSIIATAAISPLRFKGFLTHAGQTYHAKSREEILAIHRQIADILHNLKQQYLGAFRGIIASTGDTPSCSLAGDFTGIDEIRPGNFVFYDLMQLHLGSCSFRQIAAAVLCPVVSVYPSRNEALIYGGAVHLSKESQFSPDGSRIFGLAVPVDRLWHASGDAHQLWDPQQLFAHEPIWREPEGDDVVVSLSQEHGLMRTDSAWAKALKPGDLVTIIPVHSCLAADLLSIVDSL